MRKCKTLEERLSYVSSRCILLGEGTTRVVYTTNNTGYVIKIAINEEGFAQNEAEARLSKNAEQDTIAHRMLAKVRKSCTKFSWIESQIAKSLSEEDFREIQGFSWTMFENAICEFQAAREWRGEFQTRLKVWKRRSATDLVRQAERLLQSEFVDSVVCLIEDLDINAGDIKEVYHWGKTSDQRVVLLDYGLTGSVIQKYYTI